MIAYSGTPQAAVNLALTCKTSHLRLVGTLVHIRSMLPPPFNPSLLDEALERGDSEAARPLLVEAMRRLGRNVERILERLLQRGYPVASECLHCGRRYLSRFDSYEDHAHALHERGVRVPLVLEVLWQELGGFALAFPTQPVAEKLWWEANAPELVNALENSPGPDPAWIDHGAAVLRQAVQDNASAPLTLPVGFDNDTGFVFREGHVLHLAPDSFSKRLPQLHHPTDGTPLQPPGSYAVWLEPEPLLDPELLRFTPPADETMGGAEPLWRPQCSLLRYLRIAILDAGGFPGYLGLPAYEELRSELTAGLQSF